VRISNGKNGAQPRTGAREPRKLRTVVGAAGDTRDTHLHNGKCLVVQQLLLPQVIVQRRPAAPSFVRDPVRGGGGGYLL